MEDSDLITRVLAGDRAAGRMLYDAHAPRVYRLTYRMAGDPELAQEFTQETFIRAFSRLKDFRGDAALATWLHRIAVSVTMNGMRKVKRFRTREVDIEEASPMTARSDGIEPDLRDRLAKAIDSLPEIYRTTLLLHDLEGYTHTEIAKQLGVAEGTCKSRLSIARSRLREMLADHGQEYRS